MKVTIEVESLGKIGYSKQVRVPNPDIHMICLAGELSVLGIGTIKDVKVGNGSPAKHNPNAITVSGLKSITVTDDAIELEGDYTVVIKEASVKEMPSPKSTQDKSESSKEKFGKATARPTKRVKRAIVRAKESDEASE